MARYIDADKLIEALQTDYDREGAKADDMAMRGDADLSVKYNHGQFCYLNAIERVKDTPTADVVPKSEVTTLYDRIKAMPFDEFVSFFVYLNQRSIIETADRQICRKCKKEHGGHCPVGDDDKCLYELSDKETIKLWLKGKAYEN